jgi:hypothetical protein
VIYQPPPRKAPLLLRPAAWSRGVPVAVLIGASFLAVPGVYGGRLVLVALRAILEGPPLP